MTDFRRAASHWHHVGPPLRPHPTELELFRAALPRTPSPRVLLLGVTPEIHALPWPSGTDLFAVDRSVDMIEQVWPGSPDRALLAAWTALLFPDESFDAALCDNGLAMLPYPAPQAGVAAELGRVLRPGGRCVMRIFVPPDERESPDDVLADLDRIPDLNVLKFRLWMALHESASDGVRRHDVWQRIHDATGGDLAALASRTGWPEPYVLALDVHRNSEARYHFSGVDEVRELFGDGFSLESVQYPNHAFGDACPVVELRRV